MQRKYDFKNGTVMDAEQVDAEFNQLIGAVNNLESADTSIKAAAQMTKLTNDAGGVKLSTKTTADDILAILLAAGKGFHTFYAVGGSLNLPPTNISIRGIAHFTDAGIGWVYATDYRNNIFTNYYDSSTWKGWRHLVSNEDIQEELWSGGTGGFYMIGTQTVTPTKKLSECRNGWILVWSDYNPGEGAVNSDFHYSYVPKFIATKHNGTIHLFTIPYVPNSIAVKKIKVYNDKLTGDDGNQEVPNNDVALRYVLEW